MRVWCVASGKGGTSKSQVVKELSILRVAQDADARVAIADLNFDQGSLTDWWHRRGRPALPYLLEIKNFSRDVEVLRKAGWADLFIDTHPTDVEIIESAILESDYVVIPVRPSDEDFRAARAIVEICRRRRKRYAFLLTQVDMRKTNTKVNEAARNRLAEMGHVLNACWPLDTRAFGESLLKPELSAKVGHEIEPDLKKHVSAIWKELLEQLGDGEQPTAKGRAKR